MMTKQDPMQVLSATNQANVDTMQSLATISFKAAERFLALNMDFAKASLNLGANYTEQISSSDWKQTSPLQNVSFQQTTESLTNYLRETYEVATETQAEVTEIIASRVGELSESMTAWLDTLAQAAPAGSETAVAAIKSAFANTNSAYNQLIKSAQQTALTTQPVKRAKQAA